MSERANGALAAGEQAVDEKWICQQWGWTGPLVREELPDSMRARDPRVVLHGVSSREIRFCHVPSDVVRLEPRDRIGS